MPSLDTASPSSSGSAADAVGPSAFAWRAWRIADDPLFTEPEEFAEFLSRIVDLGITTIDHADIYGDHRSEAIFGAAIAQRPSLREKLRIVTKTGICPVSAENPDTWIPHYDTSAKHIVESCERSLRRLRVDVIDLFLLHRPDPLLDVDETAGALCLLQAQGNVREIGVSNYLPGQWDLLQSRLDAPLATNQIEFSALHLDPLSDGTLDQAQLHNRRPMTWSPLAGSDPLHGSSARHVELRSVMERIAAEVGASDKTEVALAFVLKHPSRPQPILGSNKLSRVSQRVGAADLGLSRRQWFARLIASRESAIP